MWHSLHCMWGHTLCFQKVSPFSCGLECGSGSLILYPHQEGPLYLIISANHVHAYEQEVLVEILLGWFNILPTVKQN